ncbi:MAG: CvpA family protein [Deltaproteobacteria bacterium]|jgi:membrane protein required for colicin V production|nr:CvpA family protein [Deltaproteobacteria bacterium]
MNGFDIAILAVLAGFLVKGLLRGLLKEVCSLAGFFVGAYLAFRYYGPLAEVLLDHVEVPVQVAVGISFTALFLATMFLFLSLGFLASKFVKLLFLGVFNRILGGAFGVVQGVLLLAMVLSALSFQTLPWGLDPAFRTAQLAPPFVELGKAALEASRRVMQ